MTKTHFRKARISQTTRFYREGSALAGTLKGGPLGLVTFLSLDSDEPRERIQRLVQLAEASCFAMQSMVSPVETTTEVTLNGERLSLP